MTRISGREYPGIRRRVAPATGLVTYQARWRARGGAEQFASFESLEDAVAYRAERLRELRMGGDGAVAGGRQRFEQWYATYVALKSNQVSTVATAESYARNHILPKWSGRRLVDITRAEVVEWVKALLDRPLKPATVWKINQIFQGAMRAAVTEGYLLGAPSLPKGTLVIPSAEARFMTGLEVALLEDAMDDHWDLIVPFLADVGLRIGELAALPVSGVDLNAGTVRVTQTVKVAKGGKLLIGDTKTRAAVRVVPTLTDEVVERVGLMIEERRLRPNDLLFQGPLGGGLHPTNFRSRYFNPAVQAAGLDKPAPTPHSLRHTAVANWIAAGVTSELMEVALWLGHSKLTTVYAYYAHLLDKPAPKTREVLSAMRREAQIELARAKAAAQAEADQRELELMESML